MPKQKKCPIGFCTECSALYRSDVAINQRCSKENKNKRCKGVVRSATCPGDFVQCSECSGVGIVAGRRCDKCGGEGWILVRGLAFPKDRV